MLRFVAWSVGDQAEQTRVGGQRSAWLGTLRRRPRNDSLDQTSVLQSTAVASSAAASVASQSPGLSQHVESGTSSGVLLWRNLVTSARQKCRASTEAVAPMKLSFTLASAGSVSRGHRGDLSGPARLVTPVLVAACDFKKTIQKNAFETVFGDVVRDFRMITFLKHTNSKILTNRFTLHDYGLRLAILNRDMCHIIRSSLPAPISQIEGILSWHQVPLPGLGLGVLRLGCDKRKWLTAKTRQVSEFHHGPEQGHPKPK